MATPFTRTTRSLTSDTSRGSLISWLLGVVFLAVWMAWFFLARIIVYEVSKTARLEVERATHPIAASIAGKIISSRLRIGQPVAEGDILVELDTSIERLQVAEAQTRLKALPPQIAAYRKEIAAQEQAQDKDRQAATAAIKVAQARQQESSAAGRFAEDNARRLETLRLAKRISEIDALRATAEAQKLHSATQALDLDIHRIESDADTRIHQRQAAIENLKRRIAALEGQWEASKAAIARLQQEIEKHTIRAPATGQIGDIAPLQTGAFVTAGTVLGAVVPPGTLKIVANFPPAAVVGRIHPGLQGRLRLDGFPWARYGVIPAKVSRVGTEIRDELVRVEFIPEANPLSVVELQHGLAGNIEVEIEQAAPVDLVLRAAGQMLTRPAQKVVNTKNEVAKN